MFVFIVDNQYLIPLLLLIDIIFIMSTVKTQLRKSNEQVNFHNWFLSSKVSETRFDLKTLLLMHTLLFDMRCKSYIIIYFL